MGKRIINHPPCVQAPTEDNGKRAASRSFLDANGTVIPKAEALSGCHSQTYSTIVPRSWTRGTLTPGLRCHILHETQFHDIKLEWTCLPLSIIVPTCLKTKICIQMCAYCIWSAQSEIERKWFLMVLVVVWYLCLCVHPNIPAASRSCTRTTPISEKDLPVCFFFCEASLIRNCCCCPWPGVRAHTSNKQESWTTGLQLAMGLCLDWTYRQLRLSIQWSLCLRFTLALVLHS